jgi:hypothetical protein
MISPTVGRIVWFYPAHLWRTGPEPLAAIITDVRSPQVVDLCVFDAVGAATGREHVDLVQDDSVQPDHAYCTWMPYQKGQAAKTEQLERLTLTRPPF